MFFIFSDVQMGQLAKFAPITKDDLSHFDGFSKTKIDKYGDKIIDEIRQFVYEYAIANMYYIH